MSDSSAKQRKGAIRFGRSLTALACTACTVLALGKNECRAETSRGHGVRSFAAAHAKGSAEIEESGSLLAFAGWLVPFNAPIVLVTYDRTQAERVAAGHFRIGFEDVLGFLPWGDWPGSGRATASIAGPRWAVRL